MRHRAPPLAKIVQTGCVEGVLGYVLGAATTGLSLLFNQWRSDRREQARMEHERRQAEAQRRSEQFAEEARWAREDARRWVAEHRQASLDLLEKLEPWVSNLRGWANPYPHSTPEQLEAERRELRRYDWEQASRESQRAWATLQLVVSDRVRDAYEALLPQMYMGIALSVGEINQEQMNNCVAEINTRYSQLLAAIRADLGVAVPARSSGTAQQPSTATSAATDNGSEPSGAA